MSPSGARRLQLAAVLAALWALSAGCGPERYGAITVRVVGEPGQDPFAEMEELVLTVTPDIGTPPEPVVSAPNASLTVSAVAFEEHVDLRLEGRAAGRVVSRGEARVQPTSDGQSVEMVLERLPGPRKLASQPRIARKAPFLFKRPEGSVLILGGAQTAAAAEDFDPVSRKFTQITSLTVRPAAALVAVGADRLLMIGGRQDGLPVASVSEFDSKTLAWRELGTLSRARARAAAVWLGEDEVLVTGGTGADGLPLADAEVFSLASNAKVAGFALSVPRMEHAAAVLSDGRVLLVGGEGAKGMSSAELVGKRASIGTTTLRAPRTQPRLIPQSNGGALILGSADSDLIERYVPGSQTTEVLGQLSPRATPAVLTGGKRFAILLGGEDATGTALTRAEILEETGARTVLEPLLTAYGAPSALYLPDGLVFLVGGSSASLYLLP